MGGVGVLFYFIYIIIIQICDEAGAFSPLSPHSAWMFIVIRFINLLVWGELVELLQENFIWSSWAHYFLVSEDLPIIHTPNSSHYASATGIWKRNRQTQGLGDRGLAFIEKVKNSTEGETHRISPHMWLTVIIGAHSVYVHKKHRRDKNLMSCDLTMYVEPRFGSCDCIQILRLGEDGRISWSSFNKVCDYFWLHEGLICILHDHILAVKMWLYVNLIVSTSQTLIWI